MCRSHFRGNLQITPDGHSPQNRRIKVNYRPFNVSQSLFLSFLAGWLVGWLVLNPRHDPETGSKKNSSGRVVELTLNIFLLLRVCN